MLQAAEVRSPEVLPSNEVIFRLVDPFAKAVELRGNFPDSFNSSTVPMIKGSDGTWSVTVGPLKSEFYHYSFYVDGAPRSDPGNPLRRNRALPTSILIVPGERARLYTVNDVPHGSVHQLWYPSPTLGLNRRMFVYTPPGYDAGTRRYPVLYLLHGGGGNEENWTADGRAAQILDNLIAAGRVEPMIVVMTNGIAKHSASLEYLPARAPFDSTSSMAFPGSIVPDVIPFIDRTFRTGRDREDRAIAGLSMGAAHAFYAAFHNLDHFAWVGGFSGAYHLLPDAHLDIPPPPDAAILREPGITWSVDAAKVFEHLPDLRPSANQRLRLLYMTNGKHDGEITQQRVLKAAFDEKGIKNHTTEIPGHLHDWAFWRLALADFLPRLFHSEGQSNGE
jgi:enterochelin esterase-like enzyme